MTANVIWIAGHHPAARHPAAHLEVGEPARLAREALREVGESAHRLAEQDAGDGEGLLHDRRDVGERYLPLRGHLLALVADPLRSQTNSGSKTRAKAASRQSSSSMATTVASTVVTFESTDVAVE